MKELQSAEKLNYQHSLGHKIHHYVYPRAEFVCLEMIRNI